MSVVSFKQELAVSRYGQNDRDWFPRWLRRYASFLGRPDSDGKLPITTEQATAFSRTLLVNGALAWQRMQAVRALEAYRELVLNTHSPCLKTMIKTLSRLAAAEKNGSPGASDEPNAVGVIDPEEPTLIQEFRRELRLHRKQMRTERAYVKWIKQYLAFIEGSGANRFREERSLRKFLTHLAVERCVAPRTQNQAKSALLFFFEKVLNQELGFLDIVSAIKAPKLPVVLTREEIGHMLSNGADIRTVQ